MDEREGEEPIRLQAYLAHCGVASRRAAEGIIQSGRVTVNGTVVTTLGTKKTAGDIVCLDGQVLTPEKRKLYIALHKPEGYLCSAADTHGRPIARDLLDPSITERVYNVGRLDLRSSGIILFTNDGEFAAIVGHPSAEIEKEYIVESTVPVPDTLLKAFLDGVDIDGVSYRCLKIERLGSRTLRIILIEGKNKEIRRVFSAFHLHARRLHRVRIGPVLLGSMKVGSSRPLNAMEVRDLLAKSRKGVE